MLALMLDLHYKSLQVVENYMGHGNAIAFKYYMKEVIPLLMTIFERLNPSIQTQVVVLDDGIRLPIEEDDTNMFGVGASMEEFS
jgi:hypothetical protein